MEKVSRENELISIVVPIYKVENYLEKCIISILNQSYKNFELLLIDDGSPDLCPKICDDYKNKDKRIKVFHKENGGLSDARNYGIEKAKGSLITFIDSDDYIDRDYIEYLYNLKKKFGVKISTCGHNICFDKKIIKKTSLRTEKVSLEVALYDILYDKEIDICSWGKLYEDTATTYLLFEKCDYIGVGNECKYNYVMRKDSITTNSFNLKKMQLIDMTQIMCDYIYDKYPSLKCACTRRLMWSYLSTYTKIVHTPKNQYKNEKNKIKKFISSNRKNVLNDNNISKRDKVSLIIYPFGDLFFKISWKIYKIIFN